MFGSCVAERLHETYMLLWPPLLAIHLVSSSTKTHHVYAMITQHIKDLLAKTWSLGSCPVSGKEIQLLTFCPSLVWPQITGSPCFNTPFWHGAHTCCWCSSCFSFSSWVFSFSSLCIPKKMGKWETLNINRKPSPNQLFL